MLVYATEVWLMFLVLAPKLGEYSGHFSSSFIAVAYTLAITLPVR